MWEGGHPEERNFWATWKEHKIQLRSDTVNTVRQPGEFVWLSYLDQTVTICDCCLGNLMFQRSACPCNSLTVWDLEGCRKDSLININRATPFFFSQAVNAWLTTLAWTPQVFGYQRWTIGRVLLNKCLNTGRFFLSHLVLHPGYPLERPSHALRHFVLDCCSSRVALAVRL